MSSPPLLDHFITDRVETLKLAVDRTNSLIEKGLLKLYNHKRLYNSSTYTKIEQYRQIIKHLNCLYFSWLSIKEFYIKPVKYCIRNLAHSNLKSFCLLKEDIRGLTKFISSASYHNLIKATGCVNKIQKLEATLILPTKYGVPRNVNVFLSSEADNLCLWNSGIYKEVVKNVRTNIRTVD